MELYNQQFAMWLRQLQIEIILAADQQGAIGLKNKMPWHLSGDLKFFKQHTAEQIMMMGHNTFKSLPSYPASLPKRISIVINSGKTCYEEERGVYYVQSNKQALSLLYNLRVDKVIIIGGSKIYQQWLAAANEIYLTRIATKVAVADTFVDLSFLEQWEEEKLFSQQADENNEYSFTIYRYRNLDEELLKKTRLSL